MFYTTPQNNTQQSNNNQYVHDSRHSSPWTLFLLQKSALIPASTKYPQSSIRRMARDHSFLPSKTLCSRIPVCDLESRKLQKSQVYALLSASPMAPHHGLAETSFNLVSSAINPSFHSTEKVEFHAIRHRESGKLQSPSFGPKDSAGVR